MVRLTICCTLKIGKPGTVWKRSGGAPEILHFLNSLLILGVTNGFEHSRACRALRFFCEREQK